MIKIQVKNIDAVQKKLAGLPPKFKKAIYDEAALYLIGDHTHGLQYYPPQVTTTNRPPYRRTYNLRFGWMTTFAQGAKMTIRNKVQYAPYVYTRWSGKPWNWRTIADIIKRETKGMMKAINAQIEREIRKAGFGHGTPV